MIRGASSLFGAGILCMLGSVAGCSAPVDDDASDADAVDHAQAVNAAAQNMRFGVAPQWYQNYSPPSTSPANVDVVVVGDWLIENGFTSAHQTKIAEITSKGKIPYFFGYIATALTKKGIGASGDCDGNTSAPLCQKGADYIRSHMSREIVPAYRAAAGKIGQAVGSAEALIHIEPDWYQFSEKAQTNAFSREESNGMMNEILGAIRAGCSSCKVVIDFSPWFSASNTQWASSAGDFYAGWNRSVVKYVGLTGKPFPFTQGKIDNFTYSDITRELGLPLVIVDAYTFGGGPIDVDSTWLRADDIARAVDMGVGLVILSQQGNVAGFDRFIRELRGGTTPTTPPTPTTPTTPPTPTPTTPTTPPSSGSGQVTVLGGNVEATLSTSSTWETGSCKKVVLKNRDSRSVTWTARIPQSGTLYNSWSALFRQEGAEWVFTGADYNKTLTLGQTADFGYCVNN